MKRISLLELALLVLSSALIVIWPMRDTIAARNILLGLCVLLSVTYLIINFKLLSWNFFELIKYWIPIALIFTFYIWVLIHYFFFATDPAEQYRELLSTWVRSFMAGILGLTLGLVINQRKNLLHFIMIALVSGFFILFYQYAVLVIGTGKIFQIMHWHSVYWGKINEVLQGTMFLAGVFGFLEIYMLKNSFEVTHNFKISKGLVLSLIYAIGSMLILYCYVFLVNTRNGMAIAFILLFLFIPLLIKKVLLGKIIISKSKIIKSLISISFMTLIVAIFAHEHSKNNAGWVNFLEDVQESMQVDRYNNWQKIKPDTLVLPNGREIPGNTYERTAWAVVGIRLITDHPLGYGLNHRAFRHLAKIYYPNSDLTLSHSGWLDMGLSFGLPGLIFALLSLGWTFFLSVTSKSQLAPSVFWWCIGIFFVYAVTEVYYYHGIEILFFWLIFLPSLLFPLNSAKI